MFGEVAPLLRVVGFEPDREECQRLTRLAEDQPWRSVTYVPCGLGAADSTAVFHVGRSRGTSSLYRPKQSLLGRFPNGERYDVVATEYVAVRSLDRIFDEAKPDIPRRVDFLKIDAQGAELDILKGARSTLCRQAVGVEVEVAFTRIYDSQALFRDVDAFLEACGFTLFKLRRKGWVRRSCEDRPARSAGQLIAGDALYLRDPLDEGRRTLPELCGHQVEALVLIATLYDLNDFALEILSDPKLSALVDAEAIRRSVEERGRRLDYAGDGPSALVAMRLFGEALRGRAGISNLFAWRLRRSWGRADSDRDFYTRIQ